MRTLPIALQLYSIREEVSEDFINTMRKVKEMGYDGVELAGLYGHSPEEIRGCLEKIGLIPISAHVPYDEFASDLQAAVRRYKTVGCSYVVIPYLMEDCRYGTDYFEDMMKNIPEIAKECQKEGMVLLYHNHDFEFAITSDKEYVLDYMYRRIPSEELQIELDTCWVKVAGVDPVEYMKKYERRIPIVHLKDYAYTDSFEFRAVGYGIQDIPSLLEQSVKGQSQWIIVEQDNHAKYSALEDARMSRDYLKNLGW